MEEITSEPQQAKTTITDAFGALSNGAFEGALEEMKINASSVGKMIGDQASVVIDHAGKTKLVEDLISDISQDKTKVKVEAGIAGATALAVFACLRFHDSHVKNAKLIEADNQD